MVQIVRLSKDMAPDDPKTVAERDDYYLRFANYEQGRPEHSDLNIALSVTDYKHKKIVTYYSDKTYGQISHKGYDQVMDVLDIPEGITTSDVETMIADALRDLDTTSEVIEQTTIIREEVDVEKLKAELFEQIMAAQRATGSTSSGTSGSSVATYNGSIHARANRSAIAVLRARLGADDMVRMSITARVPKDVFTGTGPHVFTESQQIDICVEEGLTFDASSLCVALFDHSDSQKNEGGTDQ